MSSHDNRVVLISGGASGIGAASAITLAKRGFSIVLADVNEEKGAEAVKATEAAVPDSKVAFVKLDVTSEEEWEKAVEFTVEKFGRLTTLLNSAGIGGSPATVQTTTLAEWEKVHAINSTGTFLGCKVTSAEIMKAGKEGSIINISSILGLVGGFGSAVGYHSSKGAVRLLTKSVAIFLAPSGARCNSLHPGFILTPMVTDPIDSAGLDKLLDSVPMGRHGKPEEVAKAIEFLATDDSSFCTGSELVVDGGWTCR